MNSLKKDLYNPFFSHIYVEKEVLDHPVTNRILAGFSHAKVVEINHYKDVFCRSHQDYRLQKSSMKLILASKHQNLIYEGAPVCQSFGNQHFYYTSSVMNCIYDCEYCYLQGMYPSANMVVFVNLEDIFEELVRLLKKHPVYLCISYDTDLMAMEHILGYMEKWIAFAAGHPDVTLEIRTKSADLKVIEKIPPSDNVILAWTLSPDKIISSFEHHTPSLDHRLDCIQAAIKKGFRVRLCFDPLIYCKDWREQYKTLIQSVFLRVASKQIKDVSIGVFRISQDYIKKMRRQAEASRIIQFPFENDNGVYHYGRELTQDMISYVYQLVSKEIPGDKIFL